MAKKRYAFVREPGVRSFVVRKDQPTETTVTSRPHGLETAQKLLEERKKQLVATFGDAYADDPRFAVAVNAVAQGRDPTQVLLDFSPPRSEKAQTSPRSNGW
jgi:hypothetical protein